MPYRLGFAFAIFFTAFCTCQEIKPGAAQADPAQTVSPQTAAVISGTVLQSDMRSPLKNAQVTATRGARPENFDEVEGGSAENRKFSTKTDEKGHFEFADLLPGTYYVRASHVGMVMKSALGREGILVTLEAGKPQTMNLVLLPGAVITGRILNADGEPMQHVAVGTMRYIYTIRGRILAPTGNTAETDDKGEYRLFGLQPGSYVIAADPRRIGFAEGSDVVVGPESGAARGKASSMAYMATYYPNETSFQQATPIVLKPGDETQANFSLTPISVHNISGTITGLPAAKASDKEEERYCFVIAMREGSPTPVGTAAVGKDSSFKISSVSAGKYKIVAMQPRNESGGYGYKEITVGSSDVTGVVIPMNSAVNGQITGMVRTDGEAKLDYTKLFVVLAPQTANQQADQDSAGDYGSMFRSGGGYAEVQKDGSFKMDVPSSPNGYQVVLSAQGSGFEDWFTNKVLIGGKDVLDSGFKAAEAQRGPMEIIISNKGATLEGNATDPQQKPFSNAEVIAIPSDPKLRKSFDLLHNTTADTQGHFKIRGVRPGEYIVFALEDSQAQPFLTDPFLKQNSGQVQAVKLESGTKQLQLQVIPAQAQ
ncbi:MAG TPA: carboxypeptidase-like regulatory domain-containing protein [Candidatus Angelobacter sp.]|jgi:protocatechuate 3,4-dioxygenase beta subunit